VSGFSDDGQWSWDGAQWVATSHVVLPELPMTEYERSGKLEEARKVMAQRQGLNSAYYLGPLLLAGGSRATQGLGLPLAASILVTQYEAFQRYRLWTLEQLALATAHLLGPEEPLIAAETTMFAALFLNRAVRDLAVVVTKAHVLVLRIESLDG
jgi:hypothetical protein